VTVPQAQPEAVSDLATGLDRLCEVAARELVGVTIDRASLIEAMVTHARSDPAGYLERCRATELALALACAAGDPAAIATLETRFGSTIDSVTRRFATDEHSPTDLRQILYQRLLVAEPGRRPKIADYGGHGFFENWLRVTAVRSFLDLRRRKDRAREAPASENAVLSLPEPRDLALDHLKAVYRPIVSQAFADAAAALDPASRVLLRQHFVAGMTIDQLALVLGIHRATVARRIVSAKEQLLAAARIAVMDRIGAAAEEVDSVMGLVASRLDISIGRMFASREGS